jgi:hypothetical protein
LYTVYYTRPAGSDHNYSIGWKSKPFNVETNENNTWLGLP